MRDILIPIDFSDVSRAQIEVAKLFKDGATDFELLHVYDPAPGYMGVGRASQSEDELSLQQKKGLMRAFAEELAQVDQDGKVVEYFEEGDIDERLIYRVNQLRPQFVIAGSHGHGAVYELLVGSSTEKLLQKSSVPVLVVPASYTQKNPTLKNIVVGVGFSEGTDHMLKVAVDLARSSGATLHLFHGYHVDTEMVVYEGVFPSVLELPLDQRPKEIEERLQELKKQIDYPEDKTQAYMREGPVGTRLLELAEQVHADVIVMGSHGHNALFDLLVGSITEGVIRKTDRPVMVVPSDG